MTCSAVPCPAADEACAAPAMRAASSLALFDLGHRENLCWSHRHGDGGAAVGAVDGPAFMTRLLRGVFSFTFAVPCPSRPRAPPQSSLTCPIFIIAGAAGGVPQLLASHLRRRSLGSKLAAVGLVASVACSHSLALDPAASQANQRGQPEGSSSSSSAAAAAAWGRVVEGVKARHASRGPCASRVTTLLTVVKCRSDRYSPPVCHRQDVLLALDAELGQAAQISERAGSNALAGPSSRMSSGHSAAAVTAPLGSGGYEQPRSRDVLAALGALHALLSPEKLSLFGATVLILCLCHAHAEQSLLPLTFHFVRKEPSRPHALHRVPRRGAVVAGEPCGQRRRGRAAASRGGALPSSPQHGWAAGIHSLIRV